VVVSFAATLHAPRSAVVTGNPVRTAVVPARYQPPAVEGPFSVLVLGGSLGARVFSNLVPTALVGLPMRGRIRVVQQCRTEDLERVGAAYAAAGIAAEISAFFDDVPARLAAAHLVVARAGASSVAELAVVGRPALLVPLPGAIDDHQRANAAAMSAVGGAVLLDERDLTAERLSAEVAALFGDPERLAAMAAAAAGYGRPDAGEKLADLVEAFAGTEVVR
jgi:UDP-N-acetylglucosamine--N-acetylmuramyl-(pentapeptide) pyrophosphoryl-undecaprenol N-acetylglucosamine transferase